MGWGDSWEIEGPLLLPAPPQGENRTQPRSSPAWRGFLMRDRAVRHQQGRRASCGATAVENKVHPYRQREPTHGESCLHMANRGSAELSRCWIILHPTFELRRSFAEDRSVQLTTVDSQVSRQCEMQSLLGTGMCRTRCCCASSAWPIFSAVHARDL